MKFFISIVVSFRCSYSTYMHNYYINYINKQNTGMQNIYGSAILIKHECNTLLGCTCSYLYNVYLIHIPTCMNRWPPGDGRPRPVASTCCLYLVTLLHCPLHRTRTLWEVLFLSHWTLLVFHKEENQFFMVHVLSFIFIIKELYMDVLYTY